MARGDNLKPYQFKKGQCGNPGGKPILPEAFKKLAKEKSVPILAEMCRLAMEAENEMVRVKAANIVLSYAWGRPPQQLEISQKQNPIINVTLMEPNGGPRPVNGINGHKPDIAAEAKPSLPESGN